MVINIDQEKLAETLKTSISEISRGPFESEETCIGAFDGMQILLKITKDESDFIDESDSGYACVTKGAS